MGYRGGFRLERIYHLRTKLTDVEEVKTRKAQGERDEARGALDSTRWRLQNNLEYTIRRTQAGCSALDLRNQYQHRVRLERERADREEEYRTKEALARMCREELLRVKREEQVLEKLRERHFVAETRQEKIREQKQIDETAGYQHTSKGGDGFDN